LVGFKIDEVMVGTHRFLSGMGPSGEFPLNFTLTWGNKDLLKFLNPTSDKFLHSEARGIITVGGLVDRAECYGSLHLLYFTERKVRYELNFEDDNGRQYRYVGEKVNIWPWNIYRTHFTCYGTITDLETGKIISESVVKFPYREIIPFVMSTRLRFGSVFK